MTNDSSSHNLEDIWARENPIFARKEILDIDYIPEEDRIIGRQEEIENIASSIHPAIRGDAPRNTLIYGKTGTGKSLVAKHVTRSAQDFASRHETDFGRVYIDCTQSSTETRAVVNIAQELNDPVKTEVSVPDTGLSTDAYYNKLWSIMDSLYDVVTIILDEIDKLESNDLLMQLSRAGEAGKVDSCKVGILALSNKISFKDTLDQRVLSSLQDREFVFSPYDANQLKEIMRNRKDAFKEGVLGEEVISLCAAYAAQEHGDARQALDILRNAGENAKERGNSKVTADHVKQARERADMERFAKLLEDHPPQEKAAVLALALLDDYRDLEEYSTREIYDVYTKLTEKIGLNTLSPRRFSDRLEDAVFMDILGETGPKGRGRGQGMSNYYYLLEDPEIVQKVIGEDSRFGEITMEENKTDIDEIL